MKNNIGKKKSFKNIKLKIINNNNKQNISLIYLNYIYDFFDIFRWNIKGSLGWKTSNIPTTSPSLVIVESSNRIAKQ